MAARCCLIVSLLHDVPGPRQNLAGRRHAPPAAVQATETLPERIERCGLRHQAVKIEIHSYLEALRRHHEQRVVQGFRMELLAGRRSCKA